ncbi:shikimate 5-dehydrogenase [unidentified eubacterium SCB49]|nr:shikimate 5-dehydrogenase [unidentified eubacterium SCB49]
MSRYGLIGKTLNYSFSKEFFSKKFEKEERDDTYENIELESPEALAQYLKNNKNDFKGFNVTSPYKEAVIPLLDRVNKEAKIIGAVNTIKVTPTKKLVGYNTDVYGFALTLSDFLPIKERTALILGTGGASKAIAQVLKTMDFDYKFVSRKGSDDIYSYQDLTDDVIKQHYLIINCTPLGTYPNVLVYPKIPYMSITKDHVLIDLIYNPSQTEFLKRGFTQGARVCNGLKMLNLQAKKSWSIWQK